MSFRGLNLARQPFANLRPVVRTAVALWLLGAGLLVTNVLLYQKSLSGRSGKGAELAELNERLEAARQGPVEFARQLETMDIDQMNAEVEFLNERIAGRTFGWSDLFDHLTEVLPNEARLVRLSPKIDTEEREGTEPRLSAGGVAPIRLTIAGAAQNEDSILQFVDALFAHPQFVNPDLNREARQRGGQHDFTLEVLYLSDGGENGETGAESSLEETSDGTGATPSPAGVEDPAAAVELPGEDLLPEADEAGAQPQGVAR